MNFKSIFFVISSIFGIIHCAEYYDVAGRRYYMSYPTMTNYHGALKYCNSQNMYLLDVISDAENSRVEAILNAFKRKNNIQVASMASFWTSGTDLGSEGSFYWASNGHPIHFTYWNPNQPDNQYKSERHLYQNCISIENSNMWSDSVCEDEKYFICRDTFDIPAFAVNRCSNTTA